MSSHQGGAHANPNAGEQTVYKVKRIKFLDRTGVPVFCQNYNGPCPLLAIANVLSLRNQLPDIPKSSTEVSTERLITMVGEKILDGQVQAHVGLGASASLEAHRRATVDDCLNVLPSLATGVDVNIRFDSPTGFEFTREVSVFEMLGIDLVHGWLVDPQDTTTASILHNKTYNQAVELVVAALEADTPLPPPSTRTPQPDAAPATQYEEADLLGMSESTTPKAADTPGPSAGAPGSNMLDCLLDAPASIVDPQPSSATDNPSAVQAASDDADLQLFQGLNLTDVAGHSSTVARAEATPPPLPQSGVSDQVAAAQRTRDSLIVRLFLDNHASQLTVYGLQQMADTMADNTLSVFFRNNHFNCLFKHEHTLYILVTDQGYLGVPEVVWERLDTVDGDTQMCGADFAPYKPRATATPTLVNMEALASIPPGALEGLSEADAAAIAEAAGMLTQPASAHAGGAADHAAGLMDAPQQFHDPHSPDADLALAMALQEEEDARERELVAQQAQQAQSTAAQAGAHSWTATAYQEPYVHEGYAPLQGQPQPQYQQPARPSAPPPEEKKDSSCVVM